jgi:hypothetical protein
MVPIFIVSERFTKIASVFIDVYAITIFPFIISREPLQEDVRIHESIHIEQQKELAVIFFYILYGLFFLKGLIQGKGQFEAYLDIPFEKEAYSNEDNLNYLNIRKRFSWTKYI